MRTAGDYPLLIVASFIAETLLVGCGGRLGKNRLASEVGEQHTR
ncbi:hypothetical protein [Pseudomonas sp. BN415]|nr:hypothetical protein [Pseudomonas sp. BN415]